MRRNGNFIGKLVSHTTTTASGVFDTFDAYNYRRSNRWPLSFRYLSLSLNSGTILENTTQTITLTTSGFESNTTLYWTILNGSSTSSDFFNNVVSGSFTQSGTTNTGSFSITTAFTAYTSKPTKTFQIQIRLDSTSGPVVYTSGTYSIPAITSSVSWSTSPVNEGSTSSLMITLGNVGSWSSWTASVSYTGTASSGDFAAGFPSSINVNSGTNNLNFTPVADGTTEGTETLTASVSYGGFSLGSATLSILDTSQAITATVTPTVSSVNEGSTVTFNISITSGNFSSGTLYWTLAFSGSVGNSDFSSPANAVSAGGSVTISSSAGSVAFTLASDSSTESTAESFQLQLRAGSTSGTIIQTSSSVTINDTSQGGSGYTLTAGTKSPTLGAGGHGTYPPSGWTGWNNGSVDDSFVTITIPTFTINSTAYTTAYVGSNTYITFGSGSTNYSGLSASNPALNKIHMGSSDNSYQRVSSISSGTDYTRIRYEGTASTGGTVGSPNIVYEATVLDGSKNVASYTIFELLEAQI